MINGSLWALGYEFVTHVIAGVLLGPKMIRERPAVSTALVFLALTGAHALAMSAGLPDLTAMMMLAKAR